MKTIISYTFLCLLTCLASIPVMAINTHETTNTWLWEPINELHKYSKNGELNDTGHQGRLLSLTAGETALLKLPRNYWLRLIKSDKGLTQQPAAEDKISKSDSNFLWTSTGNGLYIPADLTVTSNNNTASDNTNDKHFLLPPIDNKDLTILIKNPTNKTIQWWISRATPQKSTSNEALNYKISSPTGNYRSSWFYQNSQSKHLELIKLERQQTLKIQLQGPARWKLETRLINVSKLWQRFIDVSVELNGQHWQDFRLHPSVDFTGTLEDNECENLTSYPESFYFSIPEGEHTFSFTAPQSMAVRIFENDKNPFLFSRNNKVNIENSAPLPKADLHKQPLKDDFHTQNDFDQALLDAFYSGRLKQINIENEITRLESISFNLNRKDSTLYKWLSNSTALNVIRLRYQNWRPLGISDTTIPQTKKQFVPVKPIEILKGTNRYIAHEEVENIKLNTLFTINPGQDVLLHAPSEKDIHIIKFEFPLQDQKFDFHLNDQQGRSIDWKWRPELFEKDNFEISSSSHLSYLINGSENSQALATVSGVLTLPTEAFPIRLSHSSTMPVSFSPFYKKSRDFNLDQTSWNRALNILGPKYILNLLFRESPPVRKDFLTKSQSEKDKFIDKLSLSEKVWLDWQPLRSWLSINQQKWSYALSEKKYKSSQVKNDSLTNIIQRLSKNHDYRLLTQSLKAIALKDPNPLRRKKALNWLYSYYLEKQDSSNLSAYHSLRFQQAPKQQLITLADWLVKKGESKLALRLYSLADTHHEHMPYQYTKLKHDWNEKKSDHSPLVNLWQAIWKKNWQQAIDSSQNLKHDNPWKEFLSEIPKNEDSYNASHWLIWVQKAPALEQLEKSNNDAVLNDTPLNLSIDVLPKKSAGSAFLHNKKQDTTFQLATIEPGIGAKFHIMGPIKMQLTVRLQHKDMERNKRLDDWIEISNNGSKKWFPIINSRSAPSLMIIPSHLGTPGTPRQVTMDLGPGLHKIDINSFTQSMLISAKVFSHPILSNFVRSIENKTGSHMTAIKQSINREDKKYINAKHFISNITPHQLIPCHTQSNTLFDVFSLSQKIHRIDWSEYEVGKEWHTQHTLKEKIENLSTYSINTVENIEQYLLNVLWQWPNIENKSMLLAQANAKSFSYLKHAHIRTLINKLNQKFSWQTEEIITSSAGSRRVSKTNDSEYIIQRERLLFSREKKQGERLYGNNKLGFMLRFKKETKIRISIKQANYPYRLTPDSQLRVSLNGQSFKTLSLPPAEQSVQLTIPSGQQKIQLQIVNPTTDQWIYVKAEALILNQWKSLIKEKFTRYQVATHEQPLELHIEKPRWLRIDQFKQGSYSSRYQLHSHAGSLTLKPKKTENQAMFRVLSLKTKLDHSELLAYEFPSKASTPVNNTLATELLSSQLTPLPPLINGKFINSTIGSHSLYVHHNTRQDSNTDSVIPASEKYMEAGWRYRQKRDCLTCYWRSDILLREHTDNRTSVFGAKMWVQGSVPYLPKWLWQIKQDVYIQSTENDTWKWSAYAALRTQHSINRNIQHSHLIQANALYLSKNLNQDFIDSDVYSAYKNDHKWALRFQESISGRPWLDSYWNSHFRVVSNELDQTFTADYLQLRASWHQYWNPVEFSINYRHRTFLVDADRDKKIHEPTIGFNVKFFKRLYSGHSLGLNSQFKSDLNNNKYTIKFELNWNLNWERGLKDYSPGETLFRNIQQPQNSTKLDNREFKGGIDNE